MSIYFCEVVPLYFSSYIHLNHIEDCLKWHFHDKSGNHPLYVTYCWYMYSGISCLLSYINSTGILNTIERNWLIVNQMFYSILLGMLDSLLWRNYIWSQFSELPNTVIYWCFLMFCVSYIQAQNWIHFSYA